MSYCSYPQDTEAAREAALIAVYIYRSLLMLGELCVVQHRVSFLENVTPLNCSICSTECAPSQYCLQAVKRPFWGRLASVCLAVGAGAQ